MQHRCDSQQDCPFGQDEEGCTEFRCQGFFWCSTDKRCLSFINVCDGIIHCPLTKEDELLCNIRRCPKHCFCVGYAIHCINASLSHIPFVERNATTLILRGNKISIISALKVHKHLLHLDLSCNRINMLQNTMSPFSENMYLLYLSLNSNRLRSLGESQFKSLKNLRYLGIKDNPIGVLNKAAFLGLSRITSLIITWSQIQTLCNFCFAPLINVNTIIFTRNVITLIQINAFSNMERLRYIHFQYNRINMYDSRIVLPSLAKLESDIPGICCKQKSRNCKNIVLTYEFCMSWKWPLIWCIFVSLRLLLNIPVILVRFHRSFIDMSSVVLQNISFLEIISCMHYIFRVYLNIGNKRHTLSVDSTTFTICSISEFIFLFPYLIHSVMSCLFSIVFLNLVFTLSESLEKTALKGHKICTVLWLLCFAVSFTVYSFTGSIYGLCLPLKYIKGNHAILIYIIISATVSMIAIILKIIMIKEMIIRRETAERQETKWEKMLKVRLLLDLFINILCFIPSGILMVLISSSQNTNVMLIHGIDWLLFIKSVSTPILFTFATKSFRDFIIKHNVFHKYAKSQRRHPVRELNLESLKNYPENLVSTSKEKVENMENTF